MENDLRALISEILREARVQPEGVLLLTVDATAIEPDRFLESPIAGERFFWDSSRVEPEGERWCFAGIGVAARVDAEGPDRLTSIRAGVQRCFSSIVERSHCESAPSVRLFGGIAFRPSDPGSDPGIWRGFGDATFILPRWLYARRGEEARLRLAISLEELKRPGELLAEVDRVTIALSQQGREMIPPSGEGAIVQQSDELSLADWTAMLEKALVELRAGTFEKLVLSRRSALSIDREVNTRSVLVRMRRADPDATRFLFELAGGTFTGVTPERLFSLSGRTLETDALAGSASRRLRDGHSMFPLQHSEKDQREHAFVVEGIEAALHPLSERIDREAQPQVRTLRNIHHLWTPITAHLLRGHDVADVLSALHPTPAVCGLPRESASQWIFAHEPVPRGWYASPVGWLDTSGNAMFAVAIRSAMLRERHAYLFAGAGIVLESDPTMEYRETSTKLKTMLSALGISAAGSVPP